MKFNNKQLKKALWSLGDLGGMDSRLNPRKAWLKKNREILISQIKNTIDLAKIEESSAPFFDKIWEISSVLFSTKTVYNIVRPAVALVLILGMAGGGWITTVSASQNSLPGDFLYSVKLASEGAHLAIAQVTADEVTVASLRVERAARRIDEARQIVRVNGQDVKSAKFVQKAMVSANKEINTIKQNLQKARETNSQSVSAMARAVEREIDGIQEGINGGVNDLKQASLGTKEAKAMVEKTWREAESLALVTETAAVEVMVEKHLSGDAGVSIEDIKTKVGENLDKAIEVVVKAPEIIQEDVTREQADKIREGVDKAKQAVEEAREFLKVQNLQGVLEKVGETKKLVANVIIEAEAATSTAKIVGETSGAGNNLGNNLENDGLGDLDADADADSDGAVQVAPVAPASSTAAVESGS